MIEDLREHAQELGCEDELVGLRRPGRDAAPAPAASSTGSQDHGDIDGLMREIVAATDPDA